MLTLSRGTQIIRFLARPVTPRLVAYKHPKHRQASCLPGIGHQHGTPSLRVRSRSQESQDEDEDEQEGWLLPFWRPSLATDELIVGAFIFVAFLAPAYMYLLMCNMTGTCRPKTPESAQAPSTAVSAHVDHIRCHVVLDLETKSMMETS